MLQARSSESTTRRDFLKAVGMAGAGLTIGIALPSARTAEAAGASTAKPNGVFAPNAFVRINPDNSIAVVIKHLEMGQGTYTGLATLVAEELDADWSQIVAESAPADASRYNNLLMGPTQGTGGSTAIANSYEQMRRAGAMARAMLIAAAAAKWKVAPAELITSLGTVSHEVSGRRATFGELSTLAARQPAPDPESLILKSPKDFRLIGKSLPRKDIGKSDGTAIFTQDVKLDGMLTALVLHPPRFGAKVGTIKDQRARDVSGVVDVFEIPSGVAVLATDFWNAKKGRDLLEVDWDESGAVRRGSADLLEEYRSLTAKPGLVARNDGDAGAALTGATRVIEATYEFPYLAHATMEPMNCVVRVNGESCEIWNGAQLQTTDQALVGAALGISAEQVKINTLYAGGSFGRRANPHSDYVVEAAHIAKAKKGTPVKLVWTREDDTRAGYFRPMYVHRIRGGLDADGNPVAWEQRVVGQSILAGTPFEEFGVKDGVDASSVEGASTLPYRIPNLRVDLHTVDVGVPVQWWRSVGHTHTAYSTETFIDELAAAAGRDPVEFRTSLLRDHPRHLGALKLAAEKANWGSELPEGRARGIAVHESFSSFVAQVAEVTLQRDGGFRVERVVCAVDCGIAVNPDVIVAQMESGIGFGLSPLLMSEITLDDGKVVQSNFHDYEVLRIDQMPEIEVHIVPSAEPPTGVGEPGTPPIAPAVANALFAATGKPYHRLPLRFEQKAAG
ncbi:MAG TPA: xanthine dehydrogenase family protein molybdopterin-binding subunit [Woeseiaceae bacterium]